ncbi:apolipoprotein N-acyltransferase [Agromyces sp. MMS17-SY077]|uniref:Apolipoprotein N-acyltransferase n=1 Tax=Agromyces seonyuensis TaxID=2662446 RepID=A0A6I4NUB1_9MICO|nr:apolipoprotein N-acyltransferase [Agromyces seonyuensis]MWB97823.1 apolipoprotein N-acyltransferase [Agromyces seonyuensis]
MRTDSRLPLWLAVLLAFAAGIAFDASTPDRSWWMLAPVALVALFAALVGRGFWSGALVGLVAGGAFWLTHIEWLTLYLGPLPWAALAGVMMLWWGLGLGLTALALDRGPRAWPTRFGRLVLVPAVVAGLWVAREGIQSTWPYGGFAWGRLAIAQANGELAQLVAWVGAAGVGFLLAFLGAFALQLGREGLDRQPAWAQSPFVQQSFGRVRSSSRVGRLFDTGLGRVTALVGATAILLVFPAWPAPTADELKVAAIQGGADASLFTEVRQGEVMQAHIDETVRALEGDGVIEDVDLVVWPENGADLDPLRSEASSRVLNSLAERYDAPFVVGTITARGDDFYNTSLVWEAGVGVTDWYDKAHPVPFAEYMPDRAFWRPFAPDLIDLVSRDYTAGTRDAVFDVAGTVVSSAICFDISDDQLMYEMIGDGSQLILAQTNNADFGHTDESLQQLAIARMRAVETGRTVVNISTVGTSAIILPDGTIEDQVPTWRAESMVDSVPLATAITPASAAGRQLEWLAAGIGLAGLGVALWFGRRPKRS